MFALINRVSHFEKYIDSSIEKFIFHHKFLGFLMIFIGMPLITLAAVCVCATIVMVSVAYLFGWL